jgi:hypothetical protein
VSWWRSDENVGGIEEVRRERNGGGIRVRRRKGARKGVVESRKELRGIIFGEKGKLCWKD